MQIIECPRCHKEYKLKSTLNDTSLSYCIVCGFPLRIFLTENLSSNHSEILNTRSRDQADASTNFLFLIDRYEVKQILRQGGMGEVLLASDKKNNRIVAIKRIRNELFHHEKSLQRFTQEAKMTSRLSHPNIIPIYDFEYSETDVFYTMPYVEGETLKTRLKRALRNPSKQHEPDSGFSIQSLLQIFISICQATAYAHSKNIIHRDIKPDNILIGAFGDCYLFDWGIAKQLDLPDSNLPYDIESTPTLDSDPEITQIDRVVGTSNFLPPEAIQGKPPSKQNDIYALGVVLYQILTLSDPFKRPNISKLRNMLESETFRFEDEIIEPPIIRSPYRDIPDELSTICLKCLNQDPQTQYTDISSLLNELQEYTEGHSRWIYITTLDPQDNTQWKLQENIHLNRRSCFNTDLSAGEWVMLFISKQSFRGKIKIQMSITLGDYAEGIGIITNIPEIKNVTNINEGNRFWIASDIGQYSKFFQSNMEVEYLPDTKIERGKRQEIIIEQIDNSLQLYINGIFQCSFIVETPLCATHIGLITKDADFECNSIKVFLKHENVSVSCLAVPHAFLSHKDYASALTEYKRISQSFPGREEAREAIYYSGIALIEYARASATALEKEAKLDEAIATFDKLHSANAMPLALLGKSFVHKERKEFNEEVKCYGLALLKHQSHPQLKKIYDHCIHRMLEAAQDNRKLTIHFSYLCAKFIPSYYISEHTFRFLMDIYQSTPLPFFLDNFSISSNEPETFLSEYAFIAAFCTGHPLYIRNSLQHLFHHKANTLEPLTESLLSCLSIGCLSPELIKKCYNILDTCQNPHPLSTRLLKLFITIINLDPETPLSRIISSIDKFPIQHGWKLYVALLEKLYQARDLNRIIDLRYQLLFDILPADIKIQIDSYFIASFILLDEYDQAKELMDNYQSKYLIHESHPLFYTYIAWLYGTNQEQFAQSLCDKINHTNYPDTYSLVGHYICNQDFMEDVWLKHAFTWEIDKLYRQLELLYHAQKNDKQSLYYRNLEQKKNVSI